MSWYATKPIVIQKCRHGNHICDWCGQKVEKGSSYLRWAWFCNGRARTVKSHLRCWEAATPGAVFSRSAERPE